MDRDDIWKILQSFGFNERKLALSELKDAELIAEQICAHLGCICEFSWVQHVRDLINNCQNREPIQKRLRGDHHLDPLLLSGGVSEKTSADLGRRPFVSMASSSREKKQTRPLGIKHRPITDQSDARVKREQQQRDKWAKELYIELRSVHSPALSSIEHCVGPERIHLAIAGKTRTSTLKRYVKCWQDWQRWKRSIWGDTLLSHPSMFCEYLFSRFDEPCGPTVPGLICKAVHWFEKVAGFDSKDIVTDNRVVAQIRDYIVEQLSKEGPPPRRAPRYPVVMLESMEKTVLDEAVDMGLRVIAWTKLVKVWGGLRFDDMQKINPENLSMVGGRMTTTLRVTKTSGPGKRVQELPVCVSEYAYIWDATWLKMGFDILKEQADFERDYLIPQITPDWLGFRKKAASYHDMSIYSCHLRRALRSMTTFDALLPDGLVSFWTEHSERATLPTGLAMLGVSKPDRDLIGRWKPDASDSYVRSYNGLVAKLQGKYAGVTRSEERSRTLDEIDVVESAQSWLKARKSEIHADEREGIIEHLSETLKEFVEPGESWVEEAEVNDDTPISDLFPRKSEVKLADSNECSRKNGYVVVHNNSRCFRLHKIEGGCWMAKSKKFKRSDEYEEMPEESKYTHVCRVCWPKQLEEEDSSEDSSSTSTSSEDSSE